MWDEADQWDYLLFEEEEVEEDDDDLFWDEKWGDGDVPL